jgi:hypothetical protein
MLPRRTRSDREQPVTTRPPARPPHKIPKICCWALALALPGRSSWSLGGSAGHQRGRCLSPAFAVAPTLGTPPLLALPASAITLTGMSAPPAPGRLLASRTAIATLRMGRPEPLFTALQKTAPRSKPTPWPLIGRAPGWILRWAHGRLHSRRSSLGEKPSLFSEAFYSRIDGSLQHNLLAAITQERPLPRLAAKMAHWLAATNMFQQELVLPGVNHLDEDSQEIVQVPFNSFAQHETVVAGLFVREVAQPQDQVSASGGWQSSKAVKA